MGAKNILTHKYYVIVFAIICSIFWGASYPLLKIGYAEMQVSTHDAQAIMVLAGMRILGASVLVFFFIKFILKGSLKISREDFVKLLIVGILQTLLSQFFIYNGMANATGIKGSVLSSSSVFFVVLLAHFIYPDDRMDWRKIFGLFVGFTGIIIINLGKGAFDLDFTFRGEGFLMIYGLVTAIGNLMTKQISKSINIFLISGWQMFLGSILLTGIGLTGLKPGAITFTGKAWILLIFLIIMTAVIFTLWFALLKYNKAGEISLYTFVVPISGAVVANIFLPGEKFTLNILGAMVLVILGIAAVNYRKTENQVVANKLSESKSP